MTSKTAGGTVISLGALGLLIVALIQSGLPTSLKLQSPARNSDATATATATVKPTTSKERHVVVFRVKSLQHPHHITFRTQVSVDQPVSRTGRKTGEWSRSDQVRSGVLAQMWVEQPGDHVPVECAIEVDGRRAEFQPMRFGSTTCHLEHVV